MGIYMPVVPFVNIGSDTAYTSFMDIDQPFAVSKSFIIVPLPSLGPETVHYECGMSCVGNC